MIEAELLRDPSRIVDVGHRAAAGVALAAPQPHRDADHVMTGLAEKRGRDRRVDAAAHGGTGPSRPHRHLPPKTTDRARHHIEHPIDVGCPSTPSRATAAARRRPAARGTPMASSTCDGSIAPLLHAEAADAHTPARSSRKSRASLSTPSMHTWAEPADLARTRDGLDQTVARRRAGRRPAGRAARATRATVSAGVAAVTRIASAMATMPGDVVRAASPVALLTATDE